jgi:hypothetical protein
VPRRLSKRVLVEHVSGARKEVLRTQLNSLGPRWKRVSSRKKNPLAESAAESDTKEKE